MAAVIFSPVEPRTSPSLFSSHIVQQRQELLWMSLGIVVGYIFLSLIIKALDRLRGNRQDKLRSMEDEICQLKTELATTRARIQSLVQQGKRDTSIIGVRDNKIINQSTEIMSLKASVTRLNPFEIEANDLRPQIGLLRDEIRDKTRTIKTLRDELEKTERNLTVSNERFEFVNQNAARALETERNLRAFLGERDEAARRIGEEHREAIKNLKGEHSVTIENLKEKHDEELEMMREEHGEEIEAVRKRANEELDGIILTKNRELALLKREREPISPINDNNVSPNQSTSRLDEELPGISRVQGEFPGGSRVHGELPGSNITLELE